MIKVEIEDNAANLDAQVSGLVRTWLACISYKLSDAYGPATAPDWEGAFKITDRIKELGYEPVIDIDYIKRTEGINMEGRFLPPIPVSSHRLCVYNKAGECVASAIGGGSFNLRGEI